MGRVTSMYIILVIVEALLILYIFSSIEVYSQQGDSRSYDRIKNMNSSLVEQI